MGKKGRAAKAKVATTPTTVPAAEPQLSSAALDMLADDGVVTERLSELLDSIKCRGVLARLKTQGYSDHVAQRACLEVHQAKREVSYDSAMKWIRRRDITKIDQPLSPVELLKYLSEIVVSLVERLPKPSPPQLHRELEADPYPLAPARGSRALPRVAASSAAANASAGRAAGKLPLAPGSSSSAAAAQLGQQWQVSLAAEDAICAKLAAAEVAEGNLEAVLRELGALEEGAVEDPATSGAAGPSSGAGSVGTVTAASGGTSSGGAVEVQGALQGVAAGKISWAEAMRPDPQAAAAAQQQQQEEVQRASPQSPASSSSSSSNGSSSGGSLTARMARMVGLQNSMGRAMQALSSLRGGSGNSLEAGGEGAERSEACKAAEAAGEAVAAEQPAVAAEEQVAAGDGSSGMSWSARMAAARPPGGASAEEQLREQLGAQPREQQEPVEAQVASLRALLGVEVPMADSYEQNDAGTAYASLPSMNPEMLHPPHAAGAAAEGCSSTPEKPNPLVAEVAALRKHCVWADQHIAQLIRRVGDAERPVREEAGRLLQEVQALRADKEGLQGRLRELEQSIGRIKESCYSETAQKREFERQAAVAAAELRAAALREQEVAAEATALRKALAAERKRREAAELRCRIAADGAASSAGAAAATSAAELESLRSQLRQQAAAAAEQQQCAEHAEAMATAAAATGAAAARSRCEVLAAEKASLQTALEESASRQRQAQQESEVERTALQQQLAAAQQQLGMAQQQLAAQRQRGHELEAAVTGLRHQLGTQQHQLEAARADVAAAEGRAAAGSSAAEAAQQQLDHILRAYQQQALANTRASPANPGATSSSALSLPRQALPPPPPPPDTAAAAAATATAAAAAAARHGSAALLGAGFGVWGSSCGTPCGRSGSFLGASSPSPAASPVPLTPHPLSLSMCSSSSPLSQSGSATPQHSMHSSSFTSSPSALHPPGLFGGGPPGGFGSVFGGLPPQPYMEGGETTLGSSGLLLHHDSGIWGPGPSGGGLFALPPPPVLR